MPSNHLILCCPLLLLPSVFPSIRVFSNESVLCIRWPKYWNFSFNISPYNEHPGLISFRMDWLDLLAVQGTLKILLQHHSSKASILLCSAFFTVQLSHPYMTTGKTTALTRRTFVDQVMSLLFNMLSRLVITFLPRSKHLLISWLQSPSAVILEPPKIKSATVSPFICHEVMLGVHKRLIFTSARGMCSAVVSATFSGGGREADRQQAQAERGARLCVQPALVSATSSWCTCFFPLSGGPLSLTHSTCKFTKFQRNTFAPSFLFNLLAPLHSMGGW